MALSLAIIGAGMGGLTLAATLQQRGIDAQIYEQAPGFVRLGAGIQMSPNAMRVLRGIGLEPRIRATAFQPHSWTNRDWDSGRLSNELPLGAEAEAKYGAPYLLMHRGDLHEALVSRVPSDKIALDKKLVDLDWRSGNVTLRFADGSHARADAVIAADGIHSRVRELWLGAETANFTGRVAYRITFPAALLKGFSIDQCCKWWGPDRHIVIYFVTARRDEVYFVTSVPEPEFTVESWSATGDLGKLRAAFAGFHDQVQHVVHACPRVHKWAIVDRDPLPRWSDGAMALLGDAAHPMTQYMAQGAATAMEDAVVLSRCIAAAKDDMPQAFARYEAARRERTARIQGTSSQNTFMRQPTNPDWVYGYDAWTAPLPEYT
jgi:salicylate hydroxylase/6-hydroxynicotinate 3-monooxygenase